MREHFDAHRAFVHIERLAELRRLPGSQGELDAQQYIRSVGDEIGLPMREEPFTYTAAPLTVALPLIALLLAALSLIGSLAYLWGTAAVLVPGVGLLAVIYIGFKWSGAFELFAAGEGKGRSVNLIGEIGAASGQAQGTVILSAHYDAKSQLMPVALRAGLYLLGFLTAILFALTMIVVGIMALTGTDVLGNTAGFVVSLLPAVMLFLLVFNFTRNRSPGALDNAAGEAIIFELGRLLAEHPLANLDVVVASFGCEEVGLVGSIKFLLAHEDELKRRPCFMLNFDTPFTQAGNMFVNTGYQVPPRFTSKRLNELARDVAKQQGFVLGRVFMPVGAAADHFPWVKHGFEATGFVAPVPYIHSTRDSVERVNRESLRRVGEIALAVLKGLDDQSSTES